MALSATAASQPQVKHLLTDTNGTKVLSSQLAPRQEASCKAQFETLKAKQTLRADAQQPRRAAAATGNTDLIQAPEGLETSEFVVTAMSYAAMANITYKAQVGIDGNEMYIKGLFEQLPEAWVKGTIEGDQVTFAPDQYMGKVSIVDQFDGTDLGEWDAWMEYTVDFDSYCAATLTYNAEQGVISDEQGGLLFLSLDDDFNAAEALAYLRLTDAKAFEEVSTDLVTPPDNLDASLVEVSGVSLTTDFLVKSVGMMGFDGSDLYIMGLCLDFPSAWVKGTMDAQGQVTFARNQYIGSYQGIADIWFTGVNPETQELGDVKAQYDAETKQLSIDPTTWIVENADPVTLYYFDVFREVTVAPLQDDRGLVIPPVGLQTKSYKTTCISLGNYPYAEGSYVVRMGFDGDDAYMQGLFYYLPAAWLKGKVNADGSVTFAKNQYMGVVQGYDIYAVPCDDEENVNDEFTFKLEGGHYTFMERNTNICFAIEPDCTDAVEIIYSVDMTPIASPNDYPVITEQPEGELVNYLRSGNSYYSFFGYILSDSQNGMSMQIVYAPDGKTVYMKNPVAFNPSMEDAWVKGTIEGNKIHMPLGQCVSFDATEGYGYVTGLLHIGQIEYWGEMVDTYLPDAEATEVTYTVHADGSITLDLDWEKSEAGFANNVFGLVYTDDQSWAGFADYGTQYSLFTDQIQTLPAELTTEDWAYLYNDGTYTTSQLVQANVEGDKAYIQGLSMANPEAVIVGQIEGDKVTFASDQYVGNDDEHAQYVAFAEYEIEELFDEDWGEFYYEYRYTYLPTCTFSYDVENQVMRAPKNVALIINGGAAANGINELRAGYAPRFTVVVKGAAKPATPEILSMGNYYEDYGYDALSCDVKAEDIKGRCIDSDLLYYTIWVKVDGEALPFNFTADEYYQFPELGIEQMTEVPYSLISLDEASWEDIALGGSYICLYQSGFEDYGVQSIYYGGDVRTVSDINWLLGGVDGIKQLHTADQSAIVLDLMGRKHNATQKGLNLILKDGKALKVLR